MIYLTRIQWLRVATLLQENPESQGVMVIGERNMNNCVEIQIGKGSYQRYLWDDVTSRWKKET